MKKYLITFKNGKTLVVKGRVFLFCESNPIFPMADKINVFNAVEVLSIQEME